MAALNRVQIIGNLGADPKLRTTGTGKSVCEISVATNEKWKDAEGNDKDRTEWHRVIVWGKQGEACNTYLSKGKQVYVEGRIQTRDWEDKDGVKRWTTEIIASNVLFLGTKGDDGKGKRSEPPPVEDSDDIPF